MTRYKYLIISLISFICYNLFFINKALHIDDPFTIYMAKAVNSDFFKPALSFFSNPPFLGYYYAPIIQIFGEKEPWLHIFYFPFWILAIVAMFFLCQRFANRSLFPLLFLISTPAFIISSQGIMFDMPLLGFFLAAITAFIYGLDRDNDLLLVLSGIFAAIAILTKYSGLLLIPILLVYAMLNSGREKIKFLLIPVLIFFIWNIYCILIFGNSVFLNALFSQLRHYFLSRIGMRALASLSFLSGTSVIIVLLTPFIIQRRCSPPYVLLSLSSGMLPFVMREVFGEYSFFEKGLLAIFFFVSTYTILLILHSGFKALAKKNNKDILFLSFWFFLIFIFTILMNFIAARFMLLLLPPLFLLTYKEFLVLNFETIRLKLKLVVLSSFLFSTVLAVGDYQFAGLYRHFAYSTKKIEKAYFYCGSYLTSWGYAYYLQRLDDAIIVSLYHSMKERSEKDVDTFITPTEPVLPAVIKERSIFTKLLDSDYDRALVDSVYYRGRIFLHNKRSHTGFYSHDWGLLPFYLSIKEKPLERFEIYKLIKR